MGKLFNNNLFVQEGGGGGGTGAVDSVNGKTGTVVLTKADLGLGNVNNTSDLNKPISNATQTALDAKADASDLAALTSEFETLETNVSTLETDLGDLGDIVNQNTSDIAKKLEGTNLVAGKNITITPDADSKNYTIASPNTVTSAEVLTKTNTTAYTPEADYNPATKKYVDDSVKTKFDNANLLGGDFIDIKPVPPVGGIDTYTELMLNMDNNINDHSKNAIAYETSGTAVYGNSLLNFGNAMCFKNGVLQYPHATAFNFGTGDFTIDFWARATATTGTSGHLYFSYNTADTAGFFLDNGQVTVSLVKDTNLFTYSVTASTFNHYAIERYGDKIYFFVNGAKQSEADFTGATPAYEQFNIYGVGTDQSVFFDEVRISKGIARYEGQDFDVPTIPYTGDTGDTGMWEVNYTGTQGQQLPTGGTTGQVLAKASNTDFDVNWVDVTGGSYTLPIASADTLGGVKVGTGLSIDGEGVLSATGGTGTGDATLAGDNAFTGTNTFTSISAKATAAGGSASVGLKNADNSNIGVISGAVVDGLTTVSMLSSNADPGGVATTASTEKIATAVRAGNDFSLLVVNDKELGEKYVQLGTGAVFDDDSYVPNVGWVNTKLGDYALNSSLAAVATSGSYEDLTNKPTIPQPYTLPAATTSALGGVKPDGTTITVTPDGTISAASSGGTTDYTALTNKPQINSVELSGNKTLTDLGIQPAGSYATTAELDEYLTIDAAVAEYVAKDSLSTVATSGSYNDLTDKPEAYTLPTASTTTLGGVKVDGTTITATAEGVISAPVVNTPVATTETAGIVKPSSLTFDVEEDGTLVNKVAGSNCYIYGLKGIGSDDITIAADTTTTIPVGRLRNYDYESGDRLKVGDMLIDLKGNVAKVDRVNTAVLPAGSGPFGVDESSVLVQLQTREDDTLTTSSKEIVGAINELKTATDSKTSKPASYAKADLPTASEHFGEFAIVTDQDNMLVWSNGTAWKEVVLSDLAA